MSECYIEEQTQAFLTDQTVVNTTTRRREYFRTIDTAAGLYVADTVPNGMGEEVGGVKRLCYIFSVLLTFH